MANRSPTLVLAALLGLGTAACATQRPSLAFKSVNLQEADLEGATLNVVYTLKNPTPIDLGLSEVKYALDVEGHPVVSGKPPQGLRVGRNGSTDLTFPARILFRQIAPVVEVFLRKDAARYRASGEIGVSTPLGVVKLPVSHEGSFRVPKMPSFQFETPRIQSINLTGAQLVFPLKVTNPNEFPLPVGGFSANIGINGTKVGQSTASMPARLNPSSSQIVELPLTIHFLQTGMAVAQALRSGQAKVLLDGSLQAGSLALPVTLSQQLTFR